MQPGCAGVRLGLLAVHSCELGVGCGLRFPLCLPLVRERPGRTLSGVLFAFQGSIVEAAVTHRRNIAPLGRCGTN
ncbi:MAG: hypothetical protein ACXVFI_02655 [Solirubrobacteraceae bacterium]